MAHDNFVALFVYQTIVIIGNISAKITIRVRFLGVENLFHAFLVGLIEFNFPINQFLINFFPLFKTKFIGNSHPNLHKFTLITLRSSLTYKSFFIKIFLYTQQNLVWIYGFNQVIGNFTANCLFHNMFFLIFSNHDYRNVWAILFNLSKRIKSRNPRHIFI